jgi:hypothetical protein
MLRARRELSSLERLFALRYPGVRCKADWLEFRADDGEERHALWEVRFFAKDMKTLIRYGLATTEQFEVDKTRTYAKSARHPCFKNGLGGQIAVAVWPQEDNSELFEVRTLVVDYQSWEDRFTKKLRAQVAGCLRPFIRGTWKPPQPA